MAKTHYEFKSKTSQKFWEIETKGKAVTVRFGKIGTDGQTTVKTFDAPGDAAAHAAKVTAEKLKKGYTKINAATAERVSGPTSDMKVVGHAARPTSLRGETEVHEGHAVRRRRRDGGRSLFRASTTVAPLKQSSRTVLVTVEFWHLQADPNIVYGRFVGYGGGGAQEEGCFKLLRRQDEFFLSRSGEHDLGWQRVSSSAEAHAVAMSATDRGNVSEDILPVMDATHAERTQAAAQGAKLISENRFNEFVEDVDCVVFQPETLACLTREDAVWCRWEGQRDGACLVQISRHWPLSWSLHTKGRTLPAVIGTSRRTRRRR